MEDAGRRGRPRAGRARELVRPSAGKGTKGTAAAVALKRRPQRKAVSAAVPAPGSLEPGGREWDAFWRRVRSEGGRVMAEYGIREEAEWRAFLAELREVPVPPPGLPSRSH